MRINKLSSDGNTIKHVINGSVLTIGEQDSLSIDLQERQKDVPVFIDISIDSDGKLVEGVSHAYVANILIPARKFKTVPATETGPDGETQVSVVKRQSQPLNIKEVILTLWKLEE